MNRRHRWIYGFNFILLLALAAAHLGEWQHHGGTYDIVYGALLLFVLPLMGFAWVRAGRTVEKPE